MQGLLELDPVPRKNTRMNLYMPGNGDGDVTMAVFVFVFIHNRKTSMMSGIKHNATYTSLCILLAVDILEDRETTKRD